MDKTDFITRALVAAVMRALPVMAGALGAWVLLQWPSLHVAFCTGGGQ